MKYQKHSSSQNSEIQPDPPQPRFAYKQPVWWVRRTGEQPLPATFAYYTVPGDIPVIDLIMNGKPYRKFASHQSLTEREEEQVL